MGERCEFKIEPGACLITAPASKEILYGRMVRGIIRNLSRRYSLYEYSCVRGQKEVDANPEVEAVVSLGNRSALLGGRQNFTIFQSMHPSFEQEDYVRLEPEDEEHFRLLLAPGEEFVRADYTVSMPEDFFVVVTEDLQMLSRVLNHIKLEDFSALREAVTRLSVANISIFDEAEMLIEYTDDAIPEIIAEGMGYFLEPPQYVKSLNI